MHQGPNGPGIPVSATDPRMKASTGANDCLWA